MHTPELIFITGPNAVGKSSFIRSRISQLETFDILMTDVFKGRINLMSFEGMQLIKYQNNDFSFIKKFAQYAYRKDRMEKAAFDIISSNLDYSIETENTHKQPDEGRRFKI